MLLYINRCDVRFGSLALPPKVDIDHDGGNVRFAPEADSRTTAKNGVSSETQSSYSAETSLPV
jgi:hypothetical protein